MSNARPNRFPLGAGDGGLIADHAGRLSRYLTDGVGLYRCLDGMFAGASELVVLENCLSLEIVVVPIEELHGRRVRAVIPAEPDADRDPSSA
jgi:hypothetical protein